MPDITRSMKVTLASSICLAALAATSYAGDAGKCVIENPCSFYVQAVGGASFFVSGDVLNAVSDETGSSLNSLSFDEAFDNASTYGIRIGKACEKGRIYLGFEYTEANGGSTAIGEIPPGVLTPDDPTIVADFGNYSDYGLVLGVERDLFTAKGGGKNPVVASRLRPWVGAQIGIRFVDSIDATTHLVDPYGVIPGSATAVRFYDDSLVFTAALTLGLAFDLNDRITLGVESGLRYQTGLDEIDDDLGTFAATNDDSDLLAVPVLGTVAIKF